MMKIFFLLFLAFLTKKHNRELRIRQFLKKYIKNHRQLNEQEKEKQNEDEAKAPKNMRSQYVMLTRELQAIENHNDTLKDHLLNEINNLK